MTQGYLSDFEAFAANGGQTPAWALPLRRQAIERFSTLGFPTSKDEDWRFTNIQPIVQGKWAIRPAGSADVRAEELAPYVFPEAGWSQLVFVDGRYAPALSDVAQPRRGVTISSLAEAFAKSPSVLERFLGRQALFDRNAFTALNTAFARDGSFIHLDRDTDAGAPIHLLYVSSGRADGLVTYPRNLVVVERGAKVRVIESHIGLTDTAYLTNAVTEIVVAENASSEHIKINRESERAYHVGTTHIDQHRDSRSLSFTVTLGGAITRNNLDVVLNGADIETQLYGVSLARGSQLLDNHTSILHAHPGCRSWEVYKGIWDGQSRGVFNGKVYVTPEAQKTDAKQTNKNLLLSAEARVDTKPQLEIFADDVKCTHGATVGRLDEVSLFYMKSRGIPAALARKLLTYAFAAEVLEEMPEGAVRGRLEALVMERLGGVAVGQLGSSAMKA